MAALAAAQTDEADMAQAESDAIQAHADAEAALAAAQMDEAGTAQAESDAAQAHADADVALNTAQIAKSNSDLAYEFELDGLDLLQAALEPEDCGPR